MDDNLVMTFQNWSSDERNENIVKLHLKTGIDISVIQNWNNYEIEKTLFDF